MHAGPVWDFDLAFNIVGIDAMKDIRPAEFSQCGVRELAPDSFYIAEALWYKEYLKSPKFVQLLKERWWVLRPQFESLTTFVDSLDGLIRKAAVDDQVKWNNMDGVRYDTCTTYPSAFENLRCVYEERIVKLDSLITSLSVPL